MKRQILLLALIALIISHLLQLTALAQQPAVDSASAAQQQLATGDTASADTGGKESNGQASTEKNTLLAIIKAAGNFAYFLALDFILGIIFIAQQLLVLIREAKDAKKIPMEQIPKLGYEEIEKMFTQVKDDEIISIEKEKEELEKLPLLRRIFRRKKASAFQLAYQLFNVFSHQRSTASFTEITDSFIQYLKDTFNSFATRLSFLSDTAGALGLLGTVWGMFLLFYGADFDKTKIFQGMGLALSTTIIGLVISIVLNSLTTIVGNKFNAHLATINRVKEVFQDRLMKEEMGIAGAANPVIIKEKIVESKTPVDTGVSEKPKIKKKAKVRRPAEIKIVQGDNQTVEVGSELPEPIVVEVLDDEGKPLEGQEVTFLAEDGAGVFPNDTRTRKILTDDEGRAETKFLVGKKSGDKKITISLDGSDIQSRSLLITAKPGPAEKMVEVDGNYQTGELGKRLEKPFIVAIRDKFDNPIPRYEVNFNLVRGSGKFQDSQNAHLNAYTNESGLAEVYFVMGNDRGAREIEVEAKKVSPSKLTYEVFAN